MWVSTTYLDRSDQTSEPVAVAVVEPSSMPVEETPPTGQLQIPCEREGRKIFISPGEVAFVRADGHYTQVYTAQDRLFCAWPITEATKRLRAAGFLQTHRSYLVNPDKVARFEREKDKGRCTFDGTDLPPVPVSRSKLKDIQALILGEPGATGAT